MAAHDARDRDTAAAVVAGRRPQRPMALGVEAARDQARDEAGIGRQHLVRADHREAVAERDDDRRAHAGQRLGQHHMRRHVGQAGARGVVVPVHAEQVARVGGVRGHAGESRASHGADARRLGELGEGRQRDALAAEVFDRAIVGRQVGDRRCVGHGSPGDRLAMRAQRRGASAAASARIASRSMSRAAPTAGACPPNRSASSAWPACGRRPAAAGSSPWRGVLPATRCVRHRSPKDSRRCRARPGRSRAAPTDSRRGCRGSNAGSAPASIPALRRAAPAPG